MIWYIYVFISMLFFSLSVLLDKFLLSNKFKSPSSLLFYSSISNMLFIPLLWILGLPKIPETQLIFPLIIVGIMEVAYLYPYYKSLTLEDSSVVTALFSLSKIFLPIIAFILLKERLSFYHYIGFILIIFSSFMISKQKKLQVKKSLWYMAVAGLILAVHASVYKYNLEQLDWITAMTWTTLFSTMFIMILALTKFRKETREMKSQFLKNIYLFMTNELLNFIGIASMIYAYSLTSVTLVNGLGSLQPIIVLLLIILGQKIFPKFFKENIEWRNLLKKTVFFLLIAVGIWLTLR